ncbi:Tn5253 hypothetical protein [Streptococcus pneumoniae]|nr:Tn5253 hypothetical protein [Streptococcus pneumoniae]CIX96927.1 Tn5253 hypothetical protein [Streptococcus pneumoniae]
MKRITASQYQTSERYYKLPKLLFESEWYKNMKLEVKVVYSVLKDRLELSLSKGWIDEDGAIYLIYSNSNLMALLGCSKSKLLSIEFEVTFLDDYHKKHNYPLFYESYLQNVMEFLESQDIKNGVDASVDDHQNLVFVLYGQGYRAEGKEGILTTQVTVKAYDEDKKPINFANLLDSLIVSEYQMEPNLWEVSYD